MKSSIKLILSIFSVLFICSSTAMAFDQYYNPSCPVERFPLGVNNVNAINSVSNRVTSLELAVSLAKPNDRSGNTIDAAWIGWRKDGSDQRERKNLGQLSTGLVARSVQRLGLRTNNATVKFKINPKEIRRLFGPGKYFFYIVPTTRDGELVGRYIQRIDIS